MMKKDVKVSHEKSVLSVRTQRLMKSSFLLSNWLRFSSTVIIMSLLEWIFLWGEFEEDVVVQRKKWVESGQILCIQIETVKEDLETWVETRSGCLSRWRRKEVMRHCLSFLSGDQQYLRSKIRQTNSKRGLLSYPFAVCPTTVTITRKRDFVWSLVSLFVLLWLECPSPSTSRVCFNHQIILPHQHLILTWNTSPFLLAPSFPGRNNNKQ